MRFVSLFAGVGGFDIGFERAGWKCVGQVEIDKKARAILERHWPDVPKHDDVVTAKDWANQIGLVGNVDVVCGGFPCQDVSVAGKRAGLAGQRTGLFWDALTFSAHVKTEWFILENVPGLLSSNSGRDFGVILTALADTGYRHIEWRVLDSQFFGVPQRRRRVFLIAGTSSPSGRAIFSERESSGGDLAPSISKGQDVAGTFRGGIAGGSRSSDIGCMTFAPERERERASARLLQLDAASGVNSDNRDRGSVRPRHRVTGGDVVGCLSGGAHPGGLNGQDAYSNQLVVVDE
jgi:DNA (cytosine-5)-methyltransferase 1